MKQNVVIHSGEEGVVEAEGIRSMSLLGIIFGSFVMIMAASAGVVELAQRSFDKAELEVTGATGYPLRRETATAGESLLNRYEAVDAEAGRYRIPIERAMELEVRDAARARQGN